MKNNSEASVPFDDSLSLNTIIKYAVKKFGANPSTAKVYNKSGVLLFEEDINLVAANDVLYVAL
jgi:hypothetical protein